ncbi:MAG TPA: hypothetical protein VJX67_02540 [Blastocatellia bacterium]|nr:hypothetical protein [Blastocatellia bacterium]
MRAAQETRAVISPRRTGIAASGHGGKAAEKKIERAAAEKAGSLPAVLAATPQRGVVLELVE